MRLLTPNLKYFFIMNSEADALWGEFIIPLDERKDIYSWLSFSSDQSERILYCMLCCSLFHSTSTKLVLLFSYTIKTIDVCLMARFLKYLREQEPKYCSSVAVFSTAQCEMKLPRD